MESLVSPREKSLARVTLVLGVIAWLLIIVGTLGVALVYMLLAFIGYVFAQSAFVAYLRGTGVKLTPEQFPDLDARFKACCGRLEIAEVPDAYILSGGGMLNAFATRFLGRNFVVLLSDVVDALDTHPDGVDFYIGHELGHVKRKHLTGMLWRWPVLWLPLLGAAYSRARETTCDLHGLACSSSPENAARAMMLLAAGSKRWANANLAAYAAQGRQARGFWFSFHEIISGYPWLTHRLEHLLQGGRAPTPSRHPMAYVLALFVPYAGRAGGGAGFIVVVAIIGVLAAVALPAYRDYTDRAVIATAWTATAPVRQALKAHYEREQRAPSTLEEAGAPNAYEGQPLELDSAHMAVSVPTRAGVLMLVPELDADGRVLWHCQAGDSLRPAVLPNNCR